MESYETRRNYHRIMKAHNIKSLHSEESKKRYQKYVKKCGEKNIYFNHHEFLKALKLKNTDINLSIDRYNNYLKKYPYDYSTRAYYISALIKAKRLEEAEKELEYLEKMVAIDYDSLCNYEIYEKINSNIKYAKLKLLIYQEKYIEAYNYILDNLFTIDSDITYLQTVILYNKKKIGYCNSKYIENNDEYLASQVLNYSIDKLLNHIDKHLTNDNNIKKDREIFNSNFPVEEVISEIRMNCPNDHAIYSGLFEDTYVYKYDNCGKLGKKNTDYFKILTFHNSNKIINISPCQEGEYLDYIDLNYLNKENSDIKAVNGLDRFNKKYAKYLIKK